MKKNAFTLVEIMLGVLIVAIVMIAGFKSYTSILIGKVKIIESSEIQKQAFYFSEKFFEEIKRGGTIDYEEYFNRSVVGLSVGSGHYDQPTGFGNFGGSINTIAPVNYGSGFYYCRSNNTSPMTGTGCISDFNSTITDYTGVPQRYGQFTFQFIDYNSNADIDLGDEDGDGNIRGDDDDENLGEGPLSFSGSEVKEIYLISADKKRRTLFRWNIKDDPANVIACDLITGSGGCKSTIEFLKLEGKDWGFDHDTSFNPQTGEYDGIVDTWLIDSNFSAGSVIAGSNNNNYWQPLFSEKVTVKDVHFYVFPNTNVGLAWKDFTESSNIAPYIQIRFTIQPSHTASAGIKGNIPEIKINTTISLTDIYSR